MRADIKNQARHLFFQGKTLVQVADAVGVSKSTAERWSSDGEWVEQRNIIEHELRDKYLRENYSLYYANVLQVTDAAYRIVTEGMAERHLISEGKLAQRRMKVSNGVLFSTAKTYLSLNNILNDLDSYKRALKLG